MFLLRASQSPIAGRLEGLRSVCSSLVVRMYIIKPIGRMHHPGLGVGGVGKVCKRFWKILFLAGYIMFKFFKYTLRCFVGCKAFLVSDDFKTELQRNEIERKIMPFTLRSECQELHFSYSHTRTEVYARSNCHNSLIVSRTSAKHKTTKQESISQCMEPWKQSHCGNILQKEHAYKIYQIGL